MPEGVKFAAKHWDTRYMILHVLACQAFEWKAKSVHCVNFHHSFLFPLSPTLLSEF